ncbi:MAG: tetratricopeptide repeat protein [Deltaproteobacteria bacterium]|nr:tetratricopeptide repeat protein [Deltaproteobacteria bacterium]
MNLGVEGLLSLVELHGDELPLDRALLVAAKTEHPGLDEATYLSKIDALATTVHRNLEPGGDLVEALRRTLFGARGFRANHRHYEDPRNNLFNEVLDRRLGVPITLAAAYLAVGRRLGATVHGLGFPGRFLIAHDVGPERYLLDPLHGGARLDHRACERILHRATGRRVSVKPWMLSPSSSRKIVTRVLTNLKNAYVVARDYPGAVTAIDRILAIAPNAWSEVRDRGLLYAEIGCARAAARDLFAYVPHASATEAAAIEAYLPQLRREEQRLH